MISTRFNQAAVAAVRPLAFFPLSSVTSQSHSRLQAANITRSISTTATFGGSTTHSDPNLSLPHPTTSLQSFRPRMILPTVVAVSKASQCELEPSVRTGIQQMVDEMFNVNEVLPTDCNNRYQKTIELLEDFCEEASTSKFLLLSATNATALNPTPQSILAELQKICTTEGFSGMMAQIARTYVTQAKPEDVQQLEIQAMQCLHHATPRTKLHEAQFQLGEIFETLKKEPGITELMSARMWFLKASMTAPKNPMYQFRLGLVTEKIYLQTNKYFDSAIIHFCKAAKLQQNPEAHYRMALMYQIKAEREKSDYTELVIENLERAAHKYHAAAAYELFKVYYTLSKEEDARGLELHNPYFPVIAQLNHEGRLSKHATNALKYCILAAKGGHREAQLSLSYIYKVGFYGVQKNPVMAMYWENLSSTPPWKK